MLALLQHITIEVALSPARSLYRNTAEKARLSWCGLLEVLMLPWI